MCLIIMCAMALRINNNYYTFMIRFFMNGLMPKCIQRYKFYTHVMECTSD